MPPVLKTQVSVLMNKKMDRQDFLKYVGVGFVALTGASTVLRILVPKSQTQSSNVAFGYGASTYGGGDEPKLG